MKKLFYSILMGVIILSCNSQTKSDDSINLSFEKNSATMQALLDSYANEDVDYSRFSDLLAIDIKQAIYFLGELTGEISNDEVLGNIFSKFCIGK